MKRTMTLLALTSLLLAACGGNQESSTQPSVKDAEGVAPAATQGANNTSEAVFREEEPEGGWPDGVPPTLKAAANKQWKHSVRVTNGMRYIEMQFFTDHLLMKNIQGQPYWDTVHFDLRGDSIFPQRANPATGELEGTGDFFIIQRVWGDDLFLTSYVEADPTKTSEIPFKRVVNSVQPEQPARQSAQ